MVMGSARAEPRMTLLAKTSSNLPETRKGKVILCIRVYYLNDRSWGILNTWSVC
jgi:hypothetical protein